MMIEATIKIVERDDEKIQQIKQQLSSAIQGITAPEVTAHIDFEHLNLSSLLHALENADPFMDEERLEFTIDLLDELDIEVARFVFPKLNQWNYELATDHGPEYLGTHNFQYHGEWISCFCDTPERLPLFRMLKHIPSIFPFLAFFGRSPSDALLSEFRSQRFIWMDLKGDVDCEKFFTQENIEAIWKETSKYYMTDPSCTLNLSEHLN